jgi:hypothetical protein
MKKLVFVCLLIHFILPAQKITYSFSQPFETIKKHADLGFYRLSDNEYAELYYKKGEDMLIQIFDESFKAVKKQETIPLPKESDDYANEGFFSVKKDFFWFYSTWDRKTKTERLFALPFDKKALKFNSTEVKLVETGRLDPADKYRFYYSTDSNKLLVTYRVKPKERRDKLNKDIIGFNLFDDKMNKLYSAEIEMPYSEYDMNNMDYEIDSRGNIYMLASVRINNSLDGEVNREKGADNLYRYELIRVNQSNNTLQAIKINLDNKYTNSVLLAEDLNHDIVITGYYSEKQNSNSSNGAYIIRLEYEGKTVKDIKTTYCEFPTETLKAYESERIKKKMDKKENKDGGLEASNLYFNKIVFYEDGSVLIIGEEYYVVSHTYYNGRTSYTTYTYYYEDLLVLKADKNGKTVWCTKIPKKQSGSGTAYLSYFHKNYNGEDYFFYNEGRDLLSVKLDQKGAMTKSTILNMKTEDISVYPRSFEAVNDHVIVDRIRSDKKESEIFRMEIR